MVNIISISPILSILGKFVLKTGDMFIMLIIFLSLRSGGGGPFLHD